MSKGDVSTPASAETEAQLSRPNRLPLVSLARFPGSGGRHFLGFACRKSKKKDEQNLAV
jgi:hypothetical protein